MKNLSLFAFAVLSSGVASGIASAQDAPPPEPHSKLDMPAYEEPASRWETIEEATAEDENCRDRIREVREETGQPELEDDTGEPEEPMVIAAVDHRIDGCSVLVMRGNTDDVRPLPKPAGEPKLVPAE
ncbi:hypothetical protein K3162_01730 [Qipengyuania xiapuensis]|uniref:Uncharacterized protein n=1 Tax=Qipengyuania xiapuensis TaxID=2867236 RepID=A0ABX9A0D2_9SPHN|nr:hypothetical protein [Qipengyuania xiapuensis]QZD92793.1 hypothetical protein K3162_01730 [Qipengyuania xiapuensis]